MNIIRFFKKKFQKEEKWINIYSPVDGNIIDLSEIPDTPISEKMMGDGCGIEPLSESVYCPIDGEIDMSSLLIFIEAIEGLDLVLDFTCGGISTFLLHSPYDYSNDVFKEKVKDGFHKKNEKIFEYDYKKLKEKALYMKVPFIITNMYMVKEIKVVTKGKVEAGELIMKVLLK